MSPLIRGNESEPCTRTFCLKKDPFKKGIDIEFNVYARRVECHLRCSSGALRAEDTISSIKRRCSRRILRFELLIFMDAFLTIIFAFVFVVPVIGLVELSSLDGMGACCGVVCSGRCSVVTYLPTTVEITWVVVTFNFI
jgi:hypothetical protein